MIANRSVPSSSIIPVLAYADVPEAVEWLCRAFGFRERLRIGAHRAQLVLGGGAVIVTQLAGIESDQGGTPAVVVPDALTHSILVRVDDADRHYEQSTNYGARILHAPTDYPYGERQYTAVDPGGHRWTFSETIADVDPASWGGTAIDIG